MFKSVTTPITAKPMGTTSGGSSSGGTTEGSTVTLAQLGGVPISLIGAPNGIPQLDANKKVNQEYLDTANNSNTIIKTAVSAISAHRIIVLDADDRPVYADSGLLSHINRVVGVSINSAAMGESLEIQYGGEIKDPSFNFTPGPIYVGTDGFITTVLPTDVTAEYLQQIGIATNATTIALNILTAYKL